MRASDNSISLRRRRTAGVSLAKAAALFAGLSTLACAAIAVVWSPIMRVQRVQILVEPLPEPHELRPIRQAAGKMLGAPLATVDEKAACNSLQKVPCVRGARARRDWLRRSVCFHVTLRQPVAVLRCDVRKWEVDDMGYVIRPLRKGVSLPELTAPCPEDLYPGHQVRTQEVRAGLAACALMNTVEPLRGARVHVDQTAGICFNSPDRVVVVMGGPEDLAQKLAVVRRIYEANPDIGRRYSQINVACPRKPAVMPRESQRPERHISPAT